MLTDWLGAFALTLLVELPIYTGLLRRWCPTARAAALGLLANVITHPLLWFGLVRVQLGGPAWLIVLFLAEGAVWAVEWAVLILGLRGRGTDVRDVAAVAGLANLASAGVGLLLLG